MSSEHTLHETDRDHDQPLPCCVGVEPVPPLLLSSAVRRAPASALAFLSDGFTYLRTSETYHGEIMPMSLTDCEGCDCSKCRCGCEQHAHNQSVAAVMGYNGSHGAAS